MQFLSPPVILILGIAFVLIFLRFAKKLFFHWAILVIVEITLFALWPKSLEIIANFISVVRAIIIR